MNLNILLSDFQPVMSLVSIRELFIINVFKLGHVLKPNLCAFGTIKVKINWKLISVWSKMPMKQIMKCWQNRKTLDYSAIGISRLLTTTQLKQMNPAGEPNVGTRLDLRSHLRSFWNGCMLRWILGRFSPIRGFYSALISRYLDPIIWHIIYLPSNLVQ